MNSRSSTGYRLAIVNPMTLVGSELKSILHERGIAFQKITLLASAEEQRGAVTEVLDEVALVQPISSEELEDQDLVFFCGPAEDNQPWIELHEAADFIAIDLSQPSTVDGIPIVAGVNDDSVRGNTLPIISPHPAATPLALLLNAIRRVAPIELCVSTVIQPASEFGQSGIDELLKQTVSVLNVQSVPKQVFGRQLAFTLYPSVYGSRDESYVASQVRRVLNAEKLPLSISIAQGTTFHGHTFSVWIKLAENAQLEAVMEALRASSSLDVSLEDDPASTIEAAGRDGVLIARVSPDPQTDGAFWIWMVADNVRRSSALNAVLIAETVLERLKPVAN